MAKGKKTVFFCQNCGHEESKWLGQCPMCKEWNTFVEEKIQKIKGRKRDLVDSVVSIDRNITKSLTMEDIKEIFSVD